MIEIFMRIAQQVPVTGKGQTKTGRENSRHKIIKNGHKKYVRNRLARHTSYVVYNMIFFFFVKR